MHVTGTNIQLRNEPSGERPLWLHEAMTAHTLLSLLCICDFLGQFDALRGTSRLIFCQNINRYPNNTREQSWIFLNKTHPFMDHNVRPTKVNFIGFLQPLKFIYIRHYYKTVLWPKGPWTWLFCKNALQTRYCRLLKVGTCASKTIKFVWLTKKRFLNRMLHKLVFLSFATKLEA